MRHKDRVRFDEIMEWSSQFSIVHWIRFITFVLELNPSFKSVFRSKMFIKLEAWVDEMRPWNYEHEMYLRQLNFLLFKLKLISQITPWSAHVYVSAIDTVITFYSVLLFTKYDATTHKKHTHNPLWVTQSRARNENVKKINL